VADRFCRTAIRLVLRIPAQSLYSNGAVIHAGPELLTALYAGTLEAVGPRAIMPKQFRMARSTSRLHAEAACEVRLKLSDKNIARTNLSDDGRVERYSAAYLELWQVCLLASPCNHPGAT
jgi:hypothetical protein